MASETPALNSSLVGFSSKISDPAFARYTRNTRRWRITFSWGLAVVAIIGFTFAGATGADNLQNPEAFYYGLAIGSMFLFIGFLSSLGGKEPTWDGVVVDKSVTLKSKKSGVIYTEYAVAIRDLGGNVHSLAYEDSDAKFNYFHVGDRVRYHGGLKTFEKYDKSADTVIFCNACSTLCDIHDEYCFRCKCPLLK